jgi:hypothetical protein
MKIARNIISWMEMQGVLMFEIFYKYAGIAFVGVGFMAAFGLGAVHEKDISIFLRLLLIIIGVVIGFGSLYMQYWLYKDWCFREIISQRGGADALCRLQEQKEMLFPMYYELTKFHMKRSYDALREDFVLAVTVYHEEREKLIARYGAGIPETFFPEIFTFGEELF